MADAITAGDAPTIIDLEFTRGNDWDQPFEFVDDTTGDPLVTWAGSTFTAQLRVFEDNPVAVSFAIDMSQFVSDGRIVLSVAKEITATLKNEYVWDLERTAGDGKVSTPIAGKFTVKLDVTKPE